MELVDSIQVADVLVSWADRINIMAYAKNIPLITPNVDSLAQWADTINSVMDAVFDIGESKPYVVAGSTQTFCDWITNINLLIKKYNSTLGTPNQHIPPITDDLTLWAGTIDGKTGLRASVYGETSLHTAYSSNELVLSSQAGILLGIKAESTKPLQYASLQYNIGTHSSRKHYTGDFICPVAACCYIRPVLYAGATLNRLYFYDYNGDNNASFTIDEYAWWGGYWYDTAVSTGISIINLTDNIIDQYRYKPVSSQTHWGFNQYGFTELFTLRDAADQISPDKPGMGLLFPIPPGGTGSGSFTYKEGSEDVTRSYACTVAADESSYYAGADKDSLYCGEEEDLHSIHGIVTKDGGTPHADYFDNALKAKFSGDEKSLFELNAFNEVGATAGAYDEVSKTRWMCAFYDRDGVLVGLAVDGTLLQGTAGRACRGVMYKRVNPAKSYAELLDYPSQMILNIGGGTKITAFVDEYTVAHETISGIGLTHFMLSGVLHIPMCEGDDAPRDIGPYFCGSDMQISGHSDSLSWGLKGIPYLEDTKLPQKREDPRSENSPALQGGHTTAEITSPGKKARPVLAPVFWDVYAHGIISNGEENGNYLVSEVTEAHPYFSIGFQIDASRVVGTGTVLHLGNNGDTAESLLEYTVRVDPTHSFDDAPTDKEIRTPFQLTFTIEYTPAGGTKETSARIISIPATRSVNVVLGSRVTDASKIQIYATLNEQTIDLLNSDMTIPKADFVEAVNNLTSFTLGDPFPSNYNGLSAFEAYDEDSEEEDQLFKYGSGAAVFDLEFSFGADYSLYFGMATLLGPPEDTTTLGQVSPEPSVTLPEFDLTFESVPHDPFDAPYAEIGRAWMHVWSAKPLTTTSRGDALYFKPGTLAQGDVGLRLYSTTTGVYTDALLGGTEEETTIEDFSTACVHEVDGKQVVPRWTPSADACSIQAFALFTTAVTGEDLDSLKLWAGCDPAGAAADCVAQA